VHGFFVHHLDFSKEKHKRVQQKIIVFVSKVPEKYFLLKGVETFSGKKFDSSRKNFVFFFFLIGQTKRFPVRKDAQIVHFCDSEIFRRESSTPKMAFQFSK
jgi:hypothetical protein